MLPSLCEKRWWWMKPAYLLPKILYHFCSDLHILKLEIFASLWKSFFLFLFLIYMEQTCINSRHQSLFLSLSVAIFRTGHGGNKWSKEIKWFIPGHTNDFLPDRDYEETNWLKLTTPYTPSYILGIEFSHGIKKCDIC